LITKKNRWKLQLPCIVLCWKMFRKQSANRKIVQLHVFGFWLFWNVYSSWIHCPTFCSMDSNTFIRRSFKTAF